MRWWSVVRIDAGVENTEHARPTILRAQHRLRGAPNKTFNILDKKGGVDVEDEGPGTGNMKKAIHMEDILLTPNHGSVVGTLVDEDTENRHLPSS